jgi:hypothetical protein
MWAWPALLVTSVYMWFGGTGLASPDDGFILAQSRRILQGQIPHRDFISPRPAGSALLHTIDFLLPLPLLQASRLLSTIEVVAYTLAFARLAYRRPVREWSTTQVVGAAAAVFVNLHSFPLMAWHTIDGLFFVAVGLTVLHAGLSRDHRARVYAGLVLLGCALVMKQSFVAAPIIGLATIWQHERNERTRLVRHANALFAAAAPIALYGAVVTAAGGLQPMIVQLTRARPTFGTSLISVVWQSRPQAPVLVVCAVLLCLIDVAVGRSARSRDVAHWGARAGLSALVVGVLLVTHTDPNDAWGRSLLLLLVVVVAWEWTTSRVTDTFGISMIGIAWMTSLSWGYPTPRLVAGSIALLILDRLRRGAPRLPTKSAMHAARVATVFAVVASTAIIATAIHERAALNAIDSGRDASIGQLAPDLRGLRTDLNTTALIRDVASCRARYPARWTAVLPGPAVVYPAMNLDNPFSVDWVYPLEMNGSADRLVNEARQLDQRGNYLVLVAPNVGVANPVLDRMVQALTGPRDHCGGFVAIHSA